MAVQIQFRRDTAANWTSANPTLASGELGLETDTGQFKIGNGTTAWGSLSYGGLVGPAQTNILMPFGDGSDGAVSLSSGTTSLTRDMYYQTLTISGTANIITSGFRIFVSDPLDITAAPASAITNSGSAGGSSATTTGGTAGSVTGTNTVGPGTAGTAGGTGGTGAGAQAAAPTAISVGNGAAGGTGNAGGTGSGGAGGAARGGAAVTNPISFRRWAALS